MKTNTSKKSKRIKVMSGAVYGLVELIKKKERDAFKRGYEKGFLIGVKSRATKVLSKYDFILPLPTKQK